MFWATAVPDDRVHESYVQPFTTVTHNAHCLIQQLGGRNVHKFRNGGSWRTRHVVVLASHSETRLEHVDTELNGLGLRQKTISVIKHQTPLTQWTKLNAQAQTDRWPKIISATLRLNGIERVILKTKKTGKTGSRFQKCKVLINTTKQQN